MSDRQPRVHRIRHPWWLGAIGIAVVVGGLLSALASVVPFSSETARRKLVEGLAARLDAEVELADLRLRILPQFRAEGVGLTIRHKGRRDVPPLIAIKRFSAEGNVAGLLRRHVARVVVEELDIEIPPDRDRDGLPPDARDAHAVSGRDSYDIARTFVVDELVSNEGTIRRSVSTRAVC
jgi:hypothetical protein